MCVTYLSKHESRINSIENISPEYSSRWFVCRFVDCLGKNFISRIFFRSIFVFTVEVRVLIEVRLPKKCEIHPSFESSHCFHIIIFVFIAIIITSSHHHIITSSPPPSPPRIHSQRLSRNNCNIPNSCVSIFLSPVLYSIPECSFWLSLLLLHYEFYFYDINTYITIRNSTLPWTITESLCFWIVLSQGSIVEVKL